MRSPIGPRKRALEAPSLMQKKDLRAELGRTPKKKKGKGRPEAASDKKKKREGFSSENKKGRVT